MDYGYHNKGDENDKNATESSLLFELINKFQPKFSYPRVVVPILGGNTHLCLLSNKLWQYSKDFR